MRGQEAYWYTPAVLPTLMSEAEIRLRLEASTSGLADRVPLVSARSLVSKGQRNFFFGLVILFVIGVVVSARVTFTAITAFFTLVYLVAVCYRIYLFIAPLGRTAWRWSRTRKRSAFPRQICPSIPS